VIEQIVVIRSLEKPSLVGRLAAAAVVFDGEHAMTRRTGGRIRVGIDGPAPRAGAFVPPGRSLSMIALMEPAMIAVIEPVKLPPKAISEGLFK
jgi:hypothetical protein